MGVDLHRIGKGISSGRSQNGFGNIVSFPSVVGFPPYGTIISQTPTVQYFDVGGVNTAIGTYNVVVYADGVGGTFAQDSNVTFYPYGTQLRWETGYFTVYPCISSVNVGSYTNSWYSDGSGGFYTGSTGGYTSYGTQIDSCGGNDYFSDGNGGYYSQSSYPAYGTFLYNDPFTNNLNWSAPDGSSGTWTYSSGSCDVFANGSGGTYNSNCNGYTQPYGTDIYYGMYYDEGYMSNVSFYIRFDGSNGYYTYTY